MNANLTLGASADIGKGTVSNYLQKIDSLFTTYRRTIPSSVLNAAADAAHEIVLWTTGTTQTSTAWTKYVHGTQTSFNAADMFAYNASGRLEGSFLLEVGIMGESWVGGAVTDQATNSYYNHRGSTVIAMDNTVYQHGYDAVNNSNTKSYIPIGWHLVTTLDAPDSGDWRDKGNPNLYWRAVGTAASNTQSELVLEFPDMNGVTNTTNTEVRMVLKPLTDTFLF
jgi:hypothetical protein